MASDTKYNSVIQYLESPLPSWVPEADDARRVAAYDGYDAMYRNTPGTFIVRNGNDDVPVYVPGAKRVVEATNRYLGRGWNWTVASVNPDANTAGSQVVDLMMALHNLFIREEFKSKFYSLKRHMLQRGDALLHIYANPLALPGARLVIEEPHPRNYFQITGAGNDQVVGCYLTDLILADDGKTQIARRLEYRYDPAGTGRVWTQLTFWEPNGWDDRFIDSPALKPVATPQAFAQSPLARPALTGYFLPDSVRTIPVYLFRNQREGGEPFGTSQVSGIETLIGAINNTVSDEDITLALQGLGVYVTDSARPVADDGVSEAEWVVAPGTVIEVKTGTRFERVQGLSAMTPFQEHLKYLDDAIEKSSGLSATAIGNVDASVAASGVALRLDMAPILAQNEEKEVELLGRLDQIMFDLVTMWLPVDGTTVPPGLIVTNTFGDPLPKDRAGVIAEMVALVGAGIVSKAFAVDYLQKELGYQFPEGMLDQALAESALMDPVGDRIVAEAAGGASEGTPEPPPAA